MLMFKWLTLRSRQSSEVISSLRWLKIYWRVRAEIAPLAHECVTMLDLPHGAPTVHLQAVTTRMIETITMATEAIEESA